MAPSVLLLDYDSRSIGQVRSVLRSAGLEVRLALDGVSGIQEFHARRPDLVLVQDLLPRKHGTEVCRALKTTEAGRRTPVLLIAPEQNTRRTDLLNAGCDGFVTKPIDQERLLERVQQHLGIAKPESESKEPDTVSAARRLTPENASRNLEWIPLEIADAIEEKDIDLALGMMSWGDESKPCGTADADVKEKRPKKATPRKRSAKKTKATKARTAKKRSSKKASAGPKRKSTKKKATKQKSTRKKVTKKTSAKKKTARKKKPARNADK